MTASGPTAAPAPAAARRTLPAVLLLVAIATGFVLASSRVDFVADDAFISFRYARNLVRGEGLVYNPGERVEGYSNLLYVLGVAGLHAAGMDPVDAGRAVGVGAGALLVALTFALVHRLAAGTGRTAAAVAAAGCLAANAYFTLWSRGGLETSLYALLVVATAYPLLTRGVSRGSFLVASLLATLLTLTRMEGPAVFALVAAWAVVSARLRPREVWRVLAPGLTLFAVALVLLTLWRLAYYGEPLPNTFHAKSGFSPRHVQRGLGYLAGFGRNAYVLPAVLLGAAALALRRSRQVALLALLTLGPAAIVVAEGGDGLPAYRFAVPLLAPLFALAALGAEAVAGRLTALPRRAAAVAPAVALLLAPASAGMRSDEQHALLDAQWRIEVPRWSAVGAWLKANAPPGTTLAAVPIGAVGYHSGLPVIDMMGLVDAHIARVRIETLGAGWAGHEKHDGAYVLSRRPELLLLGNVYTSYGPLPQPGAIPSLGLPAVYARERDVLDNPVFRAEYRYAAFAIGGGLFLHCFVRQNAPILGVAAWTG